MICASDTIVRDETTLVSALDDELIMIDIAHGKYLTIDRIGAAIWQALAQPVSVDALVAHLADRYAAPPEQIGKDILPFLNNLAGRGFVRVVTA